MHQHQKNTHTVCSHRHMSGSHTAACPFLLSCRARHPRQRRARRRLFPTQELQNITHTSQRVQEALPHTHLAHQLRACVAMTGEQGTPARQGIA